jgi:RimJ/RimL family protein N-acetyltransferase
METPPPSLLPIRASRLDLRDFRGDDFDAVHRYASDPRVTRYMSWGPNTISETRGFLERVALDAEQHPRRSYELAVVERATGELIGGCGLRPRDEQPHELEIGYCFRPDRWGHGFAAETVEALLDFAYRHLGAHRVYARVDPENRASSRVLERARLRLEGHFRKDTFIRGEWRDSLIYAILDEEWVAPASSAGLT